MTTTMIYCTTGSHREAVEIGRALVEERLAACANITPSITSLYWWKGKVEESQEAVLILKTRRALTYDAIARIKQLHSYDCPCVVALAIEKGNDDFLEWIVKETTQ